VGSSGTYHICVDGDNAGLIYNLRWNSHEYTPPSDGVIPGFNVWLVISILISISIISIKELNKRKRISRKIMNF